MRIDQGRSPRGLPARKAGGPGGGRSSLGRLPPPREAWRKRTGESRRQGEAPLAWRRRGRPPARRQAPIFLPIYRKLDACDLACGAGRSASPMPPSRPNRPPSPLLRRAGVVGILCAGGFPARGSPGARIIPNSPPRRAEARKAGRPAARGTAGKNFLKKVLDTAERAR